LARARRKKPSEGLGIKKAFMTKKEKTNTTEESLELPGLTVN